MMEPTKTVSLLTNTFFTDTLPSEIPSETEDQIEDPSLLITLSREFFDMPNVIPETEGFDEYFHWDDVAG